MNDTLLQLNAIVHVASGSLMLAGGLVALAARKGSTWHVRGGRVFAWSTIPLALTTFGAMFHEFLPLAIVLMLAQAYMVPSALLCFHREASWAPGLHLVLAILCGLLLAFTALQFVRVNLAQDQLVLGPGVLAAMFAWLLAGDIAMLRGKLATRNDWIRRHLVRMILAFTVAVMALVRIGIRFGLSLEASVILPLLVALVPIALAYRAFPVDGRRAAPGRA